jgi:hypothetical protein
MQNKVAITLPQGLSDRFAWKGQTRDLKPGRNEFGYANNSSTQ